MKIFKRFIFGLFFVIVIVVAVFFIDRAFVRYYKIEKISPENKLALDFYKILKTKTSLTNAEFDKLFGAAAKLENKKISDSKNAKLFEKWLEEFKTLELRENTELYIYSSQALVQNDNLPIPSQRAYDKKVFIQIRPVFESERDSLLTSSKMIIFSVRKDKIDLPVEFVK